MRLPGAVGGELAGVHVVRTLRDVDDMAPDCGACKRALIVGVAVFASYDFQGNPVWGGVWASGFTEFINNYSWNYNVAYNPGTVNNRRTRGGPLTLNHPGYEVQSRQATGYGALITFDVGSYAAAKALLDNLEVMSLAESLGGVETLISHPASMTHASVPPDKREELGISDGMVRVSVGLEDLEDLVADLDSALAKI